MPRPEPPAGPPRKGIEYRSPREDPRRGRADYRSPGERGSRVAGMLRGFCRPNWPIPIPTGRNTDPHGKRRRSARGPLARVEGLGGKKDLQMGLLPPNRTRRVPPAQNTDPQGKEYRSSGGTNTDPQGKDYRPPGEGIPILGGDITDPGGGEYRSPGENRAENYLQSGGFCARFPLPMFVVFLFNVFGVNREGWYGEG